MNAATADVRRLSKAELEALASDEARAELTRRSDRRKAKAAGPEGAEAKAAAALGSVLEMYETGELPDAIAQTVIRRLTTDMPMNAWSLGNQLLAFRAGTVDARGFRQWEQVGRAVRKGARAFYILGPVVRKVEEEDDQGKKTTRPVVAGFRGIPVFRFEDTDGDPLPDAPDYRPPTLPPLFDTAEGLGVDVRYAPFTRDHLGYFQPGASGGGRIVLATHDERTWFHELAHAAHRRVLLARGRDLQGGQVPEQEVVAEVVAATLCRLYGLDGFIFHGYEYVKAYAARMRGGKGVEPAKAAYRVLADVQATLNVILGLEAAS